MTGIQFAIHCLWLGNVWLIASAFVDDWDEVRSIIVGLAWCFIGGWIWMEERR